MECREKHVKNHNALFNMVIYDPSALCPPYTYAHGPTRIE